MTKIRELALLARPHTSGVQYVFNQFLHSSFSFYFDGGFWRFLFLFFCAKFHAQHENYGKIRETHGQDSLLKVKSFSLLFIIRKKRGKNNLIFQTESQYIVLNLMNILTILQIIDPLTYTLWLELSNFVQKLCWLLFLPADWCMILFASNEGNFWVMNLQMTKTSLAISQYILNILPNIS